jgi:energy-coupling factor transport system substrate-specific component
MLALAVVGGVAWYERSRPRSQVVALVAALAALAAAGRVALSPIPNVVPTTDITLFSGYALGPAPGFAVGALSALASNFWLGQGPWTPWQMAGWGLCGLLGAGLALATGRRLGRLGLAAACGLAGFLYGALLDLSLMVTYGGEQSLDRFLALSARGLPFNVAHAIGNVALALVAGPALIRMLVRYRQRFEFAWIGARRKAAGAAAGLAGAMILMTLGAQAPPVSGTAEAGTVARASAASGSAVAYLRRAQNPDGGWGTSPATRSSPEMTGWAVLGLEAAGHHPLEFRRGGRTPLSYLRAHAGELGTVGDLERTVLLVAGAGLNLEKVLGGELVTRLRSARGGDGSWEGQVNLTAFGILALEAAGSTRGNGRSVAWLRRVQNPDKGWGFAPGTASDPDSTGAAMQALAVGGDELTMFRGVGWLRRHQERNGGWALLGGPVNAQSTAWAVQGLDAAGVALRSGGRRSPLDYLASVQASDGHYRYSHRSDQTPVWVTAQALLAVNREPFPVEPVSFRRPRPTPAPRSSQPDLSGLRGLIQQVTGAAPGERGERGALNALLDQLAGGAEKSPPGAPAALPALEKEDSGGSALAVGLALGGLIAALGAGWLVYRRRLP